MSTTTVTVDDHDAPAVYSGTWLSFHSDEEYMGASTWTSTAGSTATITFTGTGIAVYGTVGILGVNGTIDRSESSYAIDKETAHEWYYSTPKQQLEFQTNFWERDGLTMGQHTLTITNVKGSLYLDYFQITTPNNAQEVVGSAAPTASSSATATTSSSSQSVASATSTASFHRRSTAPIIAGAVVAGLAFLAFCLGLCVCLRRRRYSSFLPIKKQDCRVVAFPPSPTLGAQIAEASRNPGPGAVSPFDASYRSRATVFSTTTSPRKSLLPPKDTTSGPSTSSSRDTKTGSYHGGTESDDLQHHDPPPSYSIS